MWQRTLQVALAVVVIARMTGCATPSCRQEGVSETAATAIPAGECVSARPKTLSFDVSEVPAEKSPEGKPGTGANEVASDCAYRVLTAMDVQCRAVAHSALANALVSESQYVGGSRGTRKSPAESNEAKSQALAWRAAEQRNHDAAQALELYYLLAEAEQNGDLMARSQSKLDSMLHEVKKLREQGIRLAKGPGELQQKKLDLLDRSAQLRLSIEQLNGQLRQLLGFTRQDTGRIWPAADMKVVVEPVDTQAAIAMGLAHRPDLGLLRTLASSLDVRSVGAARTGLSSLNGMLGSAPGVSCLLRKAGLCEEIGTRSSQIGGLQAHQERVAEEEIRQAAGTVAVRFEQIAIAKGEVSRCRRCVESLRLERDKPGSGVTGLDIGEAELQQYDAQRRLIHHVVALRIAQVKLKESQGLLVEECCVAKSQ